MHLSELYCSVFLPFVHFSLRDEVISRKDVQRFIQHAENVRFFVPDLNLRFSVLASCVQYTACVSISLYLY